MNLPNSELLAQPGQKARPPITLSAPAASKIRIESIDLLRGLVMVIMALDHVRDYFHSAAFSYDPTDLSQTNVALFFTRWITHFCAPVFMFLSGTSAFLVGMRKGKKALSRFLLTRGLWLVFLELTVINFSWYFDPSFSVLNLLVIWALGMSMIALAGLIWLPVPVILVLSAVMIVGHNLLDSIHVPGTGVKSFLWAVLHEFQIFNWNGKLIFAGYPLIPWISVMSLGYCLGTIYLKDDLNKRKNMLLWSGITASLLFIILRYTNVYGNPTPWVEQETTAFSILSILNTHKYPPSLLYLLMTIGPSLIFLAYTEKANGWLSKKIKVIGRVPMFYYLVHIFLIHLAAMVAAEIMGFGWQSMVLKTWVNFEPSLKGYGITLAGTYLVWFTVVTILYFMCKKYDQYKRANSHKWWLSYL